MSEPAGRLDPEPAAALQGLERAFGPLQVLDVHPTAPERLPATPPPASAARPARPGLFGATPKPQPAPYPSNPEVTP